MSEYSIESLKVAIQNILKLLQKQLSKIIELLEPLRKLPELIESLGRKIVEGFRDQIQAMGEMEIYIRLASMRSKKVLISEEETSIQELKQQLEEDLESIRKRYDRIQNELNQDAHDRVREMDKHLLELYEKYFPLIFANPVAEKLEPYYNEYFASTRDAYEERLDFFWQHVTQLIEILQNFIQTRKTYSEKIDSFLHPYYLEKPEHYFLPVMFVEYEDKNEKDVKKEIYVPYQFKINNSTNNIDNLLPDVTNDLRLSPILKYIENNEALKTNLKWKTSNKVQDDLLISIENILNETNLSDRLLKGFRKNILTSKIGTLNAGEK